MNNCTLIYWKDAELKWQINNLTYSKCASIIRANTESKVFNGLLSVSKQRIFKPVNSK